MNAGIAASRLRNQIITGGGLVRPADVVGWFGAMQAQVYDAARWGIGLRLRDATDDVVERAFERGRILRTHVMRPTWHFVTPADIRWLLELTGPRVQRTMLPYQRRLELDSRTLVRATTVIERALGDGQPLTRQEVAAVLRRRGMPCDGFRLALVVMHAELEGIICSGPRRGRQFTYALIDQRAPRAARLTRDEALATLTRRYFRSHGPATARDCAWWSGLTIADVKRGLDINRAVASDVDGRTYWSVRRPVSSAGGRSHATQLLPIYDEYLVAYRDRAAVPHWPPAASAPQTFQHALIVNGQVAGAWRTTPGRATPLVEVTPLRPLTAAEQRAVDRAAERYRRYLARPVELSRRPQ
jgi:hypothetical protein